VGCCWRRAQVACPGGRDLTVMATTDPAPRHACRFPADPDGVGVTVGERAGRNRAGRHGPGLDRLTAYGWSVAGRPPMSVVDRRSLCPLPVLIDVHNVHSAASAHHPSQLMNIPMVGIPEPVARRSPRGAGSLAGRAGDRW